MRLGLLGFGVVGRGVYELLQARSDMEVVRVLCLEDIALPDAEVTKDFRAVAEDASIDTVVEAMGGLHPAYEFVRDCILSGKNIITSNKALMATFYDELIPLADKMGVKIRCTAAVGGGIGWLSELERSRRVQKIITAGGIMNGTCNYILDAMTRGGMSYGDALALAQSLGYAEANPATDVEGRDTWHKTVLSANIAFGVSLNMESVPVAGISSISAADIASFRARGLVCKLAGIAKNENGRLSAWVQPMLYPATAPEANIPQNYNLITLVGASSGRMSFYGQGAGRYPTAYNVLEDCVDILAGKGFYSPYGERKDACNDECFRYYVRGCSDSWLEENTKEVWGSAVITHPIPAEKMHAWRSEHPEVFIAAFDIA